MRNRRNIPKSLRKVRQQNRRNREQTREENREPVRRMELRVGRMKKEYPKSWRRGREEKESQWGEWN